MHDTLVSFPSLTTAIAFTVIWFRFDHLATARNVPSMPLLSPSSSSAHVQFTDVMILQKRVEESDAVVDESGGGARSNGTASMRSESSRESNENSSSGRSGKSRSLRGNLTRHHVGEDPLGTRYKEVQVLGEGSMGRVVKVRKRTEALGGSAKINLHARHRVQKAWEPCFQLPFGLGKIMEFFLRRHVDGLIKEAENKPPENEGDDSFCTSSTSSSSHGTYSTSSFQSQQKSTLCFAMKSIHLKLIKHKVYVEELQNEIEILKALDHPHIVRVISTYQTTDQLFVVMELCSGGDLYARDPYTEDEAARITFAVINALAYMHSKGVVHRDLKFENILFANGSPSAPVKLIDFGLSKQIQENEQLNEGVGTIYTMAPEVLNRSGYSKEADLWSMGVIAYMLMSSQLPFYGNSRTKVMYMIQLGKFDFVGRRWKHISNQGKAFIEDLLVMDPADRATAEDALKASWLNRRQGAATMHHPTAGQLDAVKSSIKRYVKYPRMRRLALMVVAHRSTMEEVGILRKVFQHYDTAQLGHLTYDNFKQALGDAGFSEEEYGEIFGAVDIDGTGVVTFTEFLAATLEAAGWIDEVRLAEAFDRVDHDDSGYITKDNLFVLLGDDYPENEIDSIIEEAAPNSKLGISYADFMSQWQDNKAELERDLSQHSFPDKVVSLLESQAPNRERADTGTVSEISMEDVSSDSADSRNGCFVHRKYLSERKMEKVSGRSLTPHIEECQ